MRAAGSTDRKAADTPEEERSVGASGSEGPRQRGCGACEQGEGSPEPQTPPAPWRWRPGRLLTFLCAALLVWAAWCFGYSVWRQPANVFEEIYWADVDANASRALDEILDHPLPESAMFLTSAANPLKIATLDGLGGKPYVSYKVMSDKGMPPSSNEPVDFYRYYTQLSFEVPLAVDGYEAARGSGRFVVYADAQKLYLESPSYKEPLSGTDSSIEFDFDYDLSTGQLGGAVSCPHGTSEGEALRVSVLMLQAFLTAYFDSAGDTSRFDPDDLGDWSWGEVRVRVRDF